MRSDARQLAPFILNTSFEPNLPPDAKAAEYKKLLAIWMARLKSSRLDVVMQILYDRTLHEYLV